MRRVHRLIGSGICAAGLLVPATTAAAQSYTGTGGPNAGTTSGPSGAAAGNGTQVLGIQFTRNSSGGFLASTGADIAELTVIGAGAVAVGTLLARRRAPRAS
jgi:hypothetical protein